MDSTKRELSELLRRGDLLRSVLLAGVIPDSNFQSDAYVEKIMEMAARIWDMSGRFRKDPIFVVDSIRKVVFEENGFGGKNEKTKQVFDDPNRYFLHKVLEKKEGSSLVFTLLYSILAEQVGLSYEVVALPSYYFLKVSDITGDFYVDAYDSGKLLSAADFQKKFKTQMNRNRMLSTSLFEKLKSEELVGRLFQQLKHIYILKNHPLEALRSVELLTTIYPHSPELTRDRGILYCEMEYFSKAIVDLRRYLKERPKADDVAEIKKLTSMIRGYREIVN